MGSWGGGVQGVHVHSPPPSLETEIYKNSMQNGWSSIEFYSLSLVWCPVVLELKMYQL